MFCEVQSFELMMILNWNICIVIFYMQFSPALFSWYCTRLRLKCDGTRAETRFLLSGKKRSPFNYILITNLMH